MASRSLDPNALPADIPYNLGDEIAGRVINVQLECTCLPVAVVIQTDRLTQVNRPLEISISVIAPHAVSQLQSAASGFDPCAQTNGAGARVYIWVMYFRPAKVPVLESFLDRLPTNAELDVPQTDD